jgi:L-alanine-DL-glutamate epimerase-like enolase superfamily enzyme
LDVEFHGGGLAHRHCIAAIRNTNYYELGLLHPLIGQTKPPIYPSEFTDELQNVDSNGHVAVPQGPGLGVELDWDYIASHRVDTIIYE